MKENKRKNFVTVRYQEHGLLELEIHPDGKSNINFSPFMFYVEGLYMNRPGLYINTHQGCM